MTVRRDTTKQALCGIPPCAALFFGTGDGGGRRRIILNVDFYLAVFPPSQLQASDFVKRVLSLVPPIRTLDTGHCLNGIIKSLPIDPTAMLQARQMVNQISHIYYAAVVFVDGLTEISAQSFRRRIHTSAMMLPPMLRQTKPAQVEMINPRLFGFDVFNQGGIDGKSEIRICPGCIVLGLAYLLAVQITFNSAVAHRNA